MLIQTFPETFASYKIYEIVKEVLLNNMREVDTNKVISELVGSGVGPEDFLKKMAIILKRHVHATKVSNIILSIKDKLKNLIKFEVEPAKIIISKSGSQILKVYVENRTGTMLKFKVGIQQVDRTYTALIYDSVKSFGYTKLVKSSIIEPDKMGTFKFLIKPDIYGIQDLYDLRNKKKINITLGIQVLAEGVDGLKTFVKKIPVEIVKVKI